MRAWIIAGLALCMAAGGGIGRVIEEVRLLSSDSDHLIAEVLFPDPVVRPAEGYPQYQTISLGSIGPSGRPGEPELPRVGFWVAVPPGARVEISAEGFDELVWDEIRPMPAVEPEWIEGGSGEPPAFRGAVVEDGTIYRGGIFPAAWASGGVPAHLRHLRVVPVQVSPARWDPQSGRLRIAGRIRVEVQFIPTAAPQDGRAIRQEDPSWARVYESTVVNAEAASGWARRPDRAAPRIRRVETTDLVKLEVMETGPRKVTYADLEAIGWPGSGAPLSDLRLFERFYDSNDDPDSLAKETETPIFITDADGSGSWTAGDALYFYGQTIYDRLPDAPYYLLRYGRLHVYWLGLRTDLPNERMEPASSWLGESPPVVESYPWTEHFEKEVSAYGKHGAGTPSRVIDDERNIFDGVAAIRSKHSYWQGGAPWDFEFQNGDWYSAAFDLPGFRAPLGLVARFQGFRRPPNGADEHRLYLYLANPTDRDTVRLPDTPVVVDQQDSLLYQVDGGDLLDKRLAERNNHFVHLEGIFANGIALHWFEIAYEREPRFVDRQIKIGTDDRIGPTEYQAADPPGEPILGLEFTDPLAPKVLTIDGATQIIGGGGSRRLRLQWNLDGSDRRFWLAAASVIPAPEAIILDTPSDLAADGDHDFVVVIPREWIPTLQPWVDHRESEAGGSHEVLVAAVEDVFDEFSGGRHWPHAIRSFLRTLFRTREVRPSYLMLVGDAADPFGHQFNNSDPDWVPTQTHFSTSFVSYYGRELVAVDQWFVDNLEGTGERLDFLPDMHIGRLPAGDTVQLTNMIDKIIGYETFSEDQAWRNRALFVSDDAWSSTITFTSRYQCNPFEKIFRDAGRWSIDLVNEEGGLSDFDADSFFVSAHMDTVVSLERCVIDEDTGRCAIDTTSWDIVCNPNPPSDGEPRAREYSELFVAPALRQQMNRGQLMVSFNGHANARLMTHEYIFRHSELSPRTDVDLLTNSGRPFVFMGYGCHLAEFSAYNEGDFGKADGISENMLFAANRGGIAAIASTGYEWLSLTHVYNLAVVRAFFQNPPQHEGQTRWVLGEILSRSKLNLVTQGPNNDDFLSMSATYMLLGDPGLIMDAAPPRLAIMLDGIPVTGGAILTLPADQDSILFEVQVRDEVWARSFSIEDVNGTVPPELYSVVADPSDDRSFSVLYRTTIHPRPYEIVLRAEDSNGRISSAVFTIPLDSGFELRRPGSEWEEMGDDVLVRDVDSVRVRVDLPRYVAGDDLDLLLDGEPINVRRAAIDETGDGRGAEWVLTGIDPIGEQGRRTLALRIRQPDGSFYSVSKPIGTKERFTVDTVYNVPNPFAEETWIFYQLGAPATDVSIRIFTTSGKQIRNLGDLPGQPGLNQVRWDGTDEDGDRVGNGLYFYKLFVTNAQGKITLVEKMARVR